MKKFTNEKLAERHQETWHAGFWYYAGHSLVRMHYKVWHRIKFLNQDNVPLEGGAILACNHISHLDPPAVGIGLKRITRYIAKDELFHQFFLSWFFPMCGIIPLKRGGGGKQMLEKAAMAINDGYLITMFPEGTRSKTGWPQRPRTGMIVLAAMTGAPIIPARVSGSYDCMPPGSVFPLPLKIQVAYGEPIRWAPGELDTDDRDHMVDEARRVMDAIYALPGWHPKKAKGEPAQGQESEVKDRPRKD